MARDLTPQQFASMLLRRLGIRESPGAVRAIVGWERAEGGHWKNQARHNPLNTTQPLPGAGNTGSQGNIKVYKSWDQGLEATVRTLRNGRYGGILQALKAGDAGAAAHAIGSSPWGTSGDLVSRTIGSTQAAPAAAGGAPAAAAPAAATTPEAVQPASTGVVELLAQLQQQAKPQPPPSVGLADPAHSARTNLRLPEGYQATAAGGAPAAAAKPDLGELLGAVAGSASSSSSPGVPLAEGAAEAPPGATGTPAKVARVVARASKIDAERLPYQWGGGHGPTPAKPGEPLDCSGAVSRLLGVSPRVSGQFETFGKAGRGKHVTIYANGGHVLMEINGHFWGTSATNPGGGAGWIPRSKISSGYLKGFVARHAPGM